MERGGRGGMGGETLLFCVSVKQWAAVIGQAWLVIGHVCVGGYCHGTTRCSVRVATAHEVQLWGWRWGLRGGEGRPTKCEREGCGERSVWGGNVGGGRRGVVGGV